jgi:hypothetical protein
MHESFDKYYMCDGCQLVCKKGDQKCLNCQKNCSSYFLGLMPDKIIMKRMMKDKQFCDDITKGQSAEASKHYFREIWDGLTYANIKTYMTLKGKLDFIGLIFNTDGISPFKSSKFQIWPLFMSFAQLPKIKRCLPENICLIGLYFGAKPNFKLFLKPFIHRLNKRFRNGFMFKDAWMKDRHIFPVLVGITMDLPAKAAALCIKGVGGFYACWHCITKGLHTLAGNVCYPWKENHAKFGDELRTVESFNETISFFKENPNVVGLLSKNGITDVTVFCK